MNIPKFQAHALRHDPIYRLVIQDLVALEYMPKEVAMTLITHGAEKAKAMSQAIDDSREDQ